MFKLQRVASLSINNYLFHFVYFCVNSFQDKTVFMIANLVGGSIVIPHYRRAVEYWDELNEVGSLQ